MTGARATIGRCLPHHRDVGGLDELEHEPLGPAVFEPRHRRVVDHEHQSGERMVDEV